jgi:transposase
MDTSKRFFQLHGVNTTEKVVLRKKLRRKEMMAFFEKLAPTVIGIEACGASHHWARLLRSFGHEVKLIAAQLVKPQVKRGKNDMAGAEALCEAMSRPTMRFVPMKTAEQQAALMLVGLRDRLIRNRTQLSNAICGYAAEFGVSAAKGMAHLDPLFDRIQAGESLPDLARELFAAQAEEYAQLQAQIAKVDAKLMAWHKADECSRRLAEVRGVGPIGAALLMMKTPAPEPFRSGRQFAAWVGLTPKDHSVPIRFRQTPTTYRAAGSPHRHRLIGRERTGSFRLSKCRSGHRLPENVMVVFDPKRKLAWALRRSKRAVLRERAQCLPHLGVRAQLAVA